MTLRAICMAQLIVHPGTSTSLPWGFLIRVDFRITFFPYIFIWECLQKFSMLRYSRNKKNYVLLFKTTNMVIKVFISIIFSLMISIVFSNLTLSGGDQGLLNLYFKDWATKDISKHLSFVYNMCSTATYSYLPALKQWVFVYLLILFFNSNGN